MDLRQVSFFFSNGGNVTIREGEGGDGRNCLFLCFFIFLFFKVSKI